MLTLCAFMLQIYFAQPDADGYEMQIGCTAEIVQMNVESEGIR